MPEQAHQNGAISSRARSGPGPRRCTGQGDRGRSRCTSGGRLLPAVMDRWSPQVSGLRHRGQGSRSAAARASGRARRGGMTAGAEPPGPSTASGRHRFRRGRGAVSRPQVPGRPVRPRKNDPAARAGMSLLLDAAHAVGGPERDPLDRVTGDALQVGPAPSRPRRRSRGPKPTRARSSEARSRAFGGRAEGRREPPAGGGGGTPGSAGRTLNRVPRVLGPVDDGSVDQWITAPARRPVSGRSS